MIRRFFVVILSLISIAACFLWIRSYAMGDLWLISGMSMDHRVWTQRGRVVIESTFPVPSGSPFEHAAESIDDISSWLAQDYLQALFANRPIRTFDFVRVFTPGDLFTGPTTKTAVVFPLWSVAALFGVIPAVAMVRKLQRRKHMAAGYCSQCGYDLRASPDRCPECGTAASLE